MVGVALLVSTSGCSVYEKVIGKKTSTTVSGAKAKEVPAQRRQEIAQEMTTTNNNTDKAPSREIPPIRIQPVPMPTPDTAATVAPKETTLSAIGRVLGGSWTIVQVGSTVIDRDEDMPYIVFVPGNGSFYANNGCNTLNGSYTLDGDDITFHNVLSTLRFCSDVSFDHEINTIIADEAATTLRVSEMGSETILEFVTSTGKPLMRLRRGNLEFLNGQWEITAVAGLNSLNAPATVFFDLTDMKLHGNTGCNFINGEIYLDHRTPNAVDFSQIITTLRACEFPQQQTAILVALEETSSAISDGADKVVLLDHEGRIMLELKKSPVNN